VGTFNRERCEALARGVAAGADLKSAAIAAGYGAKAGTYYRHKKRKDFAPLVARLKLEMERGGSADLGPVITDLMEGAQRAMALDTGVGMMAAARMLAEAGRLKQKLPKTRRGRISSVDDMTDQEWAERYGPKS